MIQALEPLVRWLTKSRRERRVHRVEYHLRILKGDLLLLLRREDSSLVCEHSAHVGAGDDSGMPTVIAQDQEYPGNWTYEVDMAHIAVKDT